MEREPADRTRQLLETDEDSRLAPYALRSSGARRAMPLDREGRLFDYRTEFQRDRDRVLHARAFRRLRLKSSGGALPPQEPYRDRLTHTLTVSQLGRTVARGLALNEDLVEAIALGHELGMPPFGPIGEAVLDEVLAGEAGGFRYTQQSLRVADRIEKRYDHAGLNLTDATREGVLKMGPLPSECPGELKPDWPPFFEAQVVAALEPAARALEDLDDGLRAGEVEIEAVERLPLVRELLRRIGEARERPAASGRGALHRRANRLHRGLSHMLVTGIIQASRRSLKSWARSHDVRGHRDYLAARPRVDPATIGLTPAAARMYDGLRDFVASRLHQGAWLRAARLRASRVIVGLYRSLRDDPRLAEDYLLLRFREQEESAYLRDVPAAGVESEIARRYRGSAAWARLVADHIAGMTDAFAIAEHERMVGP